MTGALARNRLMHHLPATGTHGGGEGEGEGRAEEASPRGLWLRSSKEPHVLSGGCPPFLQGPRHHGHEGGPLCGRLPEVSGRPLGSPRAQV